MKFGVREICDVVLRAKATQQIGNKVFYENEPVIYFDTLKTSSMEGASTTVYAQGGRGNSRLIAWEGERTVTFTMEDALISPIGFMILSGAGLVEAGGNTVEGEIVDFIKAEGSLSGDNLVLDINGRIVTDAENITVKAIQTNAVEYLLKSNMTIPATSTEITLTSDHLDKFEDLKTYLTSIDTTVPNDVTIKYSFKGETQENTIKVHCTETLTVNDARDIYLGKKPYSSGDGDFIYVMLLDKEGEVCTEPFIYRPGIEEEGKGYHIVQKSTDEGYTAEGWGEEPYSNYKVDGKYTVLVDYYTEKSSGAQQIDITPDSFGGNFYLEASTLFRNTKGVDMPAEFIIPNCKIQSNFTFTMASSGDPSSFTFTMDAFPDYTRFDRTKKVLAAIQIIEEEKDENTGWGTARTSTSAASGR